jgi:glutaconate CoA-transferase, subunit B
VSTTSWTIDEWFVVALARTIADREVVFHGFASPCAQVAMHVAKRTHAPDSLLVEGATYAVDPVPAFVPPTSNDLALHRDAVYRMRFEEFFDAACRGAVDRMFLSGGQIDAHGSTNVTGIGPWPHPKIKLGGGGGGCNISASVGTLTVWTTRHRSGRTLVAGLDFLTDIGHRTREGTRP